MGSTFKVRLICPSMFSKRSKCHFIVMDMDKKDFGRDKKIIYPETTITPPQKNAKHYTKAFISFGFDFVLLADFSKSTHSWLLDPFKICDGSLKMVGKCSFFSQLD
jgi:hypothetical protein